MKVHAIGGLLLVDSTFGPPPLQYPFKWGADCVLHSGMPSIDRYYGFADIQLGTKYFGGHSDLLSGVLVVKTPGEWKTVSNVTFPGPMTVSMIQYSCITTVLFWEI